MWEDLLSEGAGILDKSAHGLRKAAAIRAADNGATAHELMATFGWIDIRKLRFTPGRPTESGLHLERWASLNVNSLFSHPFEGGNIRGKNPCNINCRFVRWCARSEPNPISKH